MIFALCFLFFLFPTEAIFGLERADEKPIVIVTTSYNNARWVEQNLRSIFSQDYSHYRLIYIDDASEDKTADKVQELVSAQSKKCPFQLIRNEKRKGSLFNIYNAIHTHCLDEEIVVLLDGDDWFYDEQVLKKVNSVYSKGNVWLTHGAFIEYPSKKANWSKEIPTHIVTQNAFRRYRMPSHLKTFYAWLFKKIKKEDLLYEGEFFAMTGDQAMMFPMIEMAGARHAFISDLTYVYNRANPINDDKVNSQFQKSLEIVIRSKPSYQPLDYAIYQK